MSHSFEAVEGQYLLASCPLPPYKDCQGGNFAVRLSFFEHFTHNLALSPYVSDGSEDVQCNSCEWSPSTLFCINIGKELYIYAQENQGIPLDRRVFKVCPTCHAFKQDSTDASLLVGLTNGEVHLIYPTRKDFFKVFNEEKSIDKTPVTCIGWVPNSPNQFIVSHLSGCLYLYDEKLSPVLNPPAYEPFKESIGFTVFTCKAKSTRNPLYRWVFGSRGDSCSISSLGSVDGTFRNTHVHGQSENGFSRKCSTIDFPHDFLNNSAVQCFQSLAGDDTGINQFTFSPCGAYLAVVTQDGYLRVVAYHTMELYGYMRSYFAGLLCVDWSPDGCFVAVGGQDDLVTVWSMAERTVICRCEGHRSWVSTVRFDPFLCPPLLEVDKTRCTDIDEYTTAQYHRSPVDSQQGWRSHVKNSTSSSDTQSHEAVVLSHSYRLGSVGQDTTFCLWDLTEDIIRQGIAFARAMFPTLPLESEQLTKPDSVLTAVKTADSSTKRASTSGRSSLRAALSNSKSQFRGRTSVGQPQNLRNLLSFLTLRRRKSRSLHPSSVDACRTGPLISVDVDRSKNSNATVGLHSENPSNSDQINTDRSAWNHAGASNDSSRTSSLVRLTDLRIFPDLHDQYIFGSPMCPRFCDVPVLEPLVCTVMHQHRLTDLVFRRHTVHVVCQQGLIRSWSRPNRLKEGEFPEEMSNEGTVASRASELSGARTPPQFPNSAVASLGNCLRSNTRLSTSEDFCLTSVHQSTCPHSCASSGVSCSCTLNTDRNDEPSRLRPSHLPNPRFSALRGASDLNATGPVCLLKSGYPRDASTGPRLYGKMESTVNCTDV